MPLIKKLLLQKVSHFHKGIQNRFKRQELEIFLPLLGIQPKNFFYKILLIFTKEFKMDFRKTEHGIIQPGNRIISPTSRPLTKKLLLHDVSHFWQGVQNRF